MQVLFYMQGGDSTMNTFLQAMFETLIRFGSTSLHFCSVNSHYQCDVRKIKKGLKLLMICTFVSSLLMSNKLSVNADDSEVESKYNSYIQEEYEKFLEEHNAHYLDELDQELINEYSIKWENSYNRIHNIWNLSKNGLHYSLN